MTYFPITASVVSAEALTERVLTRYRLGGPVSCRLLQRGVNDTYVVQAGSTIRFLRVYTHRWRTQAEIDAEIDMLRYLARQKQPVSKPLQRKDGRFVTRVAAPEGARYAVLFTAAVGSPPDFNKLTYCRQYGEICARFHALMDRRKSDGRRFHIDLQHLITEPLKNIAPYLQDRPQDFDYLKSAGAQMGHHVDSLLSTEPGVYGFCHGDHHGGNVHIDPGGKMTVFDFDCYGHGWRAYDIAVFRWALVLRYGLARSGKTKTTRRWNAFLEGYTRIRSLSPQELRATSVFVALRHLWLIGLHTGIAPRIGALPGPYFDSQIGFIRNYIAASRGFRT